MTAATPNTPAVADPNNPFGGLAQQLTAMSPELQQQLAEQDNGIHASGSSLPRLRMKQNMLEFVKDGVIANLGTKTERILLGATGVVARTFNPNVYDPKNPLPPACVSTNGVNPDQIFKGTPLVVDRGTGQQRPATMCSECPEGMKGGRCDYLMNTVWVDPANVSEDGMAMMPIKNASLFHDAKRPLSGNNAELEVGFQEYAGRIAGTMIGNQALRSYMVKTKIEVFPQTGDGFATAFGIAVDPTTQQFASNDAATIQLCSDLTQTPRYQELLTSAWMPDDNGATETVAQNVPQVNTAPAPQAAEQPVQHAMVDVPVEPTAPASVISTTPNVDSVLNYIKTSGVMATEWVSWIDTNIAWIQANPAQAKEQLEKAYPDIWSEAETRLQPMAPTQPAPIPVIETPAPVVTPAASAPQAAVQPDPEPVAQPAQPAQPAPVQQAAEVAQPTPAATEVSAGELENIGALMDELDNI